jgi:zinc and cadmium transporter
VSELAALPPFTRLAIYAAAVLVSTMVAALWPATRTRKPGQAGHTALSVAAGVMLGAAFFHMLPEAIRLAGPSASYAVVLGFVTIFLLERVVLVHACEMLPEPVVAEAGVAAETAHVHVHDPAAGDDCAEHPQTLGLTAFVGFSLHTLTDGVALGSAVAAAGLGPVVLLAIVLHKIPLSFSLAGVLRHEGRSTGRVLAMVGVFAAMVPLGAGLYLLAARWLTHAGAGAITPYALAFSAGTFLHVAFSDLLPEIHRRRRGGLPAAAVVAGGLLVMYLLTFLEH